MSEIREEQEAVSEAGQREAGLFPSSPIQREIEVILGRQLAGYLALPVVIMDASNVVVYYNEPAERILGRRFDEGEAVPLTNWSDVFEFTNDAGEPIPGDTIPLASAVRERRLTHGRFWMRGRDGVRHHVEAIGIPLIGNAGRFLGAISVLETVSD